MTTDELIGRGWEFPPVFDKTSMGTGMLSGEADVDNSIYVILHTRLGERIMREQFGSNIYELLFEPLTANMKTYMASSLKSALVDNEPRIVIESLVLEQKDPTLGKVDILITYTLIETNETRNLVLPFYTPDQLR